MRITIKSLTILLLFFALCSCDGKEDKSMLLKDWKIVYVPLDPQTLTSMNDDTLENYGLTKAEDFQLIFTYIPSIFSNGQGQGVVVYSDETELPSGCIFTEMRVWQCYEAVINDPQADGIHVNYNSQVKNPYTVSKSELEGALPLLPKQEIIKFNISFTR